jgi:hypothetical protein
VNTPIDVWFAEQDREVEAELKRLKRRARYRPPVDIRAAEPEPVTFKDLQRAFLCQQHVIVAASCSGSLTAEIEARIKAGAPVEQCRYRFNEKYGIVEEHCECDED